MVAQGALDSQRLRLVVEHGGAGVGGDVVERVGRQTGLLQRQGDGPRRLDGVGARRRHVVGIAGGAEAQHLGVDGRVTAQGVAELFQDHQGRALGHHKAVTVAVEGP